MVLCLIVSWELTILSIAYYMWFACAVVPLFPIWNCFPYILSYMKAYNLGLRQIMMCTPAFAIIVTIMHVSHF